MKSYTVSFTIEGTLSVNADNPEDAKAVLDRFSIGDIAAMWGTLEVHEPVEKKETESVS